MIHNIHPGLWTLVLFLCWYTISIVLDPIHQTRHYYDPEFDTDVQPYQMMSMDTQMLKILNTNKCLWTCCLYWHWVTNINSMMLNLSTLKLIDNPLTPNMILDIPIKDPDLKCCQYYLPHQNPILSMLIHHHRKKISKLTPNFWSVWPSLLISKSTVLRQPADHLYDLISKDTATPYIFQCYHPYLAPLNNPGQNQPLPTLC